MADNHDQKQDVEVDAAKRETLRRMIASTAFVAPVIASFPISGMKIDKAQAFTPYTPPYFVDPFFRLFS